MEVAVSDFTHIVQTQPDPSVLLGELARIGVLEYEVTHVVTGHGPCFHSVVPSVQDVISSNSVI